MVRLPAMRWRLRRLQLPLAAMPEEMEREREQTSRGSARPTVLLDLTGLRRSMVSSNCVSRSGPELVQRTCMREAAMALWVDVETLVKRHLHMQAVSHRRTRGRL